MATTVDTPGIYPDLPIEDYLADPVPGGSLSRSGARALLPPSCPARYHYDRQHPPDPKHAFDVGHAAHKLVLGSGPRLHVVDADSWRTKAAQAERDDARGEGAVPLLRDEYDHVAGMAQALREHPLASALFNPDAGRPEQSLFWRDPQAGIMRRARLDWLPDHPGGRLIIPDYKTTTNASAAAVQRAVDRFGYHQQGAWYLDGVAAVDLADDAAFLLVVQETTPPYLVTVAELDLMNLRIGDHLNRQAIDIYVECTTTGTWPAYATGIELISPPPWVENRYLQETAA